MTLYTPANAQPAGADHPAHEFRRRPGAASGHRRTRRRRHSADADPPVAAEILARGWGYATVGYKDIQPDRVDAWTKA